MLLTMGRRCMISGCNIIVEAVVIAVVRSAVKVVAVDRSAVAVL